MAEELIGNCFHLFPAARARIVSACLPYQISIAFRSSTDFTGVTYFTGFTSFTCFTYSTGFTRYMFHRFHRHNHGTCANRKAETIFSNFQPAGGSNFRQFYLSSNCVPSTRPAFCNNRARKCTSSDRQSRQGKRISQEFKPI